MINKLDLGFNLLKFVKCLNVIGPLSVSNVVYHCISKSFAGEWSKQGLSLFFFFGPDLFETISHVMRFVQPGLTIWKRLQPLSVIFCVESCTLNLLILQTHYHSCSFLTKSLLTSTHQQGCSWVTLTAALEEWLCPH